MNNTDPDSGTRRTAGMQDFVYALQQGAAIAADYDAAMDAALQQMSAWDAAAEEGGDSDGEDTADEDGNPSDVKRSSSMRFGMTPSWGGQSPRTSGGGGHGTPRKGAADVASAVLEALRSARRQAGNMNDDEDAKAGKGDSSSSAAPSAFTGNQYKISQRCLRNAAVALTRAMQAGILQTSLLPLPLPQQCVGTTPTQLYLTCHLVVQLLFREATRIEERRRRCAKGVIQWISPVPAEACATIAVSSSEEEDEANNDVLPLDLAHRALIPPPLRLETVVAKTADVSCAIEASSTSDAMAGKTVANVDQHVVQLSAMASSVCSAIRATFPHRGAVAGDLLEAYAAVALRGDPSSALQLLAVEGDRLTGIAVSTTSSEHGGPGDEQWAHCAASRWALAAFCLACDGGEKISSAVDEEEVYSHRHCLAAAAHAARKGIAASQEQRESPTGWICARGTRTEVLCRLLLGEIRKRMGVTAWLDDVKAAVRESEVAKKFAGVIFDSVDASAAVASPVTLSGDTEDEVTHQQHPPPCIAFNKPLPPRLHRLFAEFLSGVFVSFRSEFEHATFFEESTSVDPIKMPPGGYVTPTTSRASKRELENSFATHRGAMWHSFCHAMDADTAPVLAGTQRTWIPKPREGLSMKQRTVLSPSKGEEKSGTALTPLILLRDRRLNELHAKKTSAPSPNKSRAAPVKKSPRKVTRRPQTASVRRTASASELPRTNSTLASKMSELRRASATHAAKTPEKKGPSLSSSQGPDVAGPPKRQQQPSMTNSKPFVPSGPSRNASMRNSASASEYDKERSSGASTPTSEATPTSSAPHVDRTVNPNKRPATASAANRGMGGMTGSAAARAQSGGGGGGRIAGRSSFRKTEDVLRPSSAKPQRKPAHFFHRSELHEKKAHGTATGGRPLARSNSMHSRPSSRNSSSAESIVIQPVHVASAAAALAVAVAAAMYAKPRRELEAKSRTSKAFAKAQQDAQVRREADTEKLDALKARSTTPLVESIIAGRASSPRGGSQSPRVRPGTAPLRSPRRQGGTSATPSAAHKPLSGGAPPRASSSMSLRSGSASANAENMLRASSSASGFAEQSTSKVAAPGGGRRPPRPGSAPSARPQSAGPAPRTRPLGTPLGLNSAFAGAVSGAALSSQHPSSTGGGTDAESTPAWIHWAQSYASNKANVPQNPRKMPAGGSTYLDDDDDEIYSDGDSSSEDEADAAIAAALARARKEKSEASLASFKGSSSSSGHHSIPAPPARPPAHVSSRSAYQRYGSRENSSHDSSRTATPTAEGAMA